MAVINLLVNGSQVSALKLNEAVSFETLVDGRPVIPETWEIFVGATRVLSGVSKPISFTPTVMQAHSVHVTVITPEAFPQEAIFTYPVAQQRAATAALSVKWSKSVYAERDALTGSIVAYDPEGLPAKITGWTLRWNNKVMASGNSSTICYSSCYHGIWRADVRGTDFYGVPLQGDSTVFVQLASERRDTPKVEPIDGTLVYLGAVFSNQVKSDGGTATSLPCQTMTFRDSASLLPGTTHILFDIDPGYSSVDDEVVIRSSTGNYTLLSMLSGQDVGYDCVPMGYIPAPADLRLGYTVDVFNTSGYTYAGSDFRVRIKCYRLTNALYRYDPCPYALHPGGTGARARRWGLMFTSVEAEASGNRLTYSTQEPTNIPLMSMSSTGVPNPYDAQTKSIYTESNRYAIYELANYPDLDAKAVCAIEGLRPFCMALQSVGGMPDFRTLVRLKGRMVVYFNGAALTTGSTIRVRVQTGAGESVLTLPVTEDVYNASDDTFVCVGAVDLDLTDYQFDFNGVVAWVELDETLAVNAAPGTLPTPAWGPDNVFTGLFNGTVAQAVAFDGACYGSPVKMAVVDSESASVVTQISGCADPSCGPVGVYCYTATCLPDECVCVAQPLHNPSPYVAYGTAPMRNFANPKFLSEGTGTFGGYFIAVDGQLCGDGYIYDRCDMKSTAVVVYPCLASPHPYILCLDSCYTYRGVVTTYGTDVNVPVAQVVPVSGCDDYFCTRANGAGSCYAYFDAESGDKVVVDFEGLDIGVPVFGAAPAKIDLGSVLTDGAASLKFTSSSRLIFATCSGAGILRIDVGLAYLSKRIVVSSGGAERTIELAKGAKQADIAVAAGDALSLDISVFGGFPKSIRNTNTLVKWTPYVDIPRLYDVAYGSVAGTFTISALGFTGPVDRMPYQLYRTMPSDVQADIVNPDSLVTVQGVDVPTPEYALLRCRGIGELPPNMPVLTWYSGQSFTGQVKFNFYALRGKQAAHGEMDVWFSNDGEFPDYLLAQPYRALLKDSRSYRCDSTLPDAHRNVFAASASINGAALPSVYADAVSGQVISSKASTVTIKRGAQTLSKVRVDAGISSNVQATDDTQITWAHLSDYGFDYPQRTDISNLVHSWNPDFIVAAGDNWQSGATNSLTSIDNKTGSYYHDFIYPYIGAYGAGASEQRFFATPGNHDHTPPGGGPIVPATYRLPMFLRYFDVPAQNHEVVKWPVHFFLIDNTDYLVGGDMSVNGYTAQWLKAKLAASTAPWKVVILHYPPWCSGSGHIPYTALRWPYKTWGADVLMSGHVHVYERFMMPDGLVAITCGTCNPAYWGTMSPSGIWNPAAEAYSTFGYGVAPMLAATCRSKATPRSLLIEYITTGAAVIDSVTLTK